MNNMKIFGYVRVSTKEQNEDRQLISIRKMGVEEKKIYIDKVSGKNFERPQYKRLLKKLDKNSVLYKFCNFCGQSFEFPDLDASSLKQENSNVCRYHVECDWDDGGEELQLFVSDSLNSIDGFSELFDEYNSKDCLTIVKVIPELPLNGIDSISFFEVYGGKEDEIYLEIIDSSNEKRMGRTIKKRDVEKVVEQFISGQVLEGEFEELVY